jgi:hypothetical protein
MHSIYIIFRQTPHFCIALGEWMRRRGAPCMTGNEADRVLYQQVAEI